MSDNDNLQHVLPNSDLSLLDLDSLEDAERATQDNNYVVALLQRNFVRECATRGITPTREQVVQVEEWVWVMLEHLYKVAMVAPYKSKS